MLLFAILVVTLIVLLSFLVLAVGVGGGVFLIVFGDVAVCVAILSWIIFRFIRKKKNK